MPLHLSSSSLSVIAIVVLIISIYLPQSLLASSNYDTCKDSTIICGGNLGSVGYPFYDGSSRPNYCGYPGFEISCHGPQTMTIASQTYYVMDISTTNRTITIARDDLFTGQCPTDSIAINFTLFTYTSSDENITLYYNCSSTDNAGVSATTCDTVPGKNNYYLTQSMVSSLTSTFKEGCSGNLFVPVVASKVSTFNSGTLVTALQAGFELEWFADDDACSACQAGGGECGYDWTSNKFACYCSDGTSNCSSSSSSGSSSGGSSASGSSSAGSSASGKSKSSIKTGVIAGIAPLMDGVLILSIIVLTAMVLIWRVAIPRILTILCEGKSSESVNIEAFLREHDTTAPKRYPYRDIKRMTNNFRDKLGEGGYGNVFKGKLNDNCLVAVKLLKKSKGNGEEFINEVASISRTNHVNVVALLGFCSERSKRALVYEFMPNGSLEKFLYNKDNTQSLSINTLFQIATGIARGLEYLHRGCNTRILHFDIKPHNILLDEDFQPKISDFGLAKSCLPKRSIISMSGMRGTAGYIAPEVFCRSIGSVSHKSDVYSYGMMVLDMVGSRRNDDLGAESSSEIYFPNHTYRQLIQGKELCHSSAANQQEQELLMKLLLVSFWCIQTNPASRPPIDRVVDMLALEIEALEIPPMPTLSSPTRSPPNFSSTSMITSSGLKHSLGKELDEP